jgi:hypothetical protein
MLDPLSIAAATIVAKWFAEGAVKEIGGTVVVGALKKVYDAVHERLSAHHEGTTAIARLQERPSSEARALELAETLDEQVKGDPKFKAMLQTAIEEAGSSPETGKFVTQVMDNAKVGKITNIGIVHGNVTF